MAGTDDIVPTRPRCSLGQQLVVSASRINTGVTDILEWIDRESGIDQDLLVSANGGIAKKGDVNCKVLDGEFCKIIRRIGEWQIVHRIPYDGGMSEEMCYFFIE